MKKKEYVLNKKTLVMLKKLLNFYDSKKELN